LELQDVLLKLQSELMVEESKLVIGTAAREFLHDVTRDLGSASTYVNMASRSFQKRDGPHAMDRVDEEGAQ
jgi:hypothetical protein